jgi:hypothetical protein
MNTTWLKRTALVALLAVSTSCYGSFGLFNRFHKWNGTLGDKWINTMVHVAFWIVPVYQIILFGDFVLLNTIEFWTGENPVDTASVDNKGVAHIAVGDKQYTVRPLNENSVVLGLNGQDVAVARAHADGSWNVLEFASGTEVEVTQAQVQALSARL